jgi:disulfide bond formation protein DsbB
MAALFRPRVVFAVVFLACAGLVAGALYLQHAEGQEPCPMCILQRYAFVVAGAIALIAALHDPARRGVAVYGGLMSVAALLGGGVAARQTWLQHNPPAIAECGPGLEAIVDGFPLGEALPMIFKGSGDCSEVKWTWLSLSIAEWALVAFVAILVAAVLAWRFSGIRRRG